MINFLKVISPEHHISFSNVRTYITANRASSPNKYVLGNNKLPTHVPTQEAINIVKLTRKLIVQELQINAF